MIICGIDPGTNTGVAFYDVESLKLISLHCVKVHQAFGLVLSTRPLFVRVEDARQRGSFGKMDEELAKYGYGVREGAGAAKRDSTIWEDFLKDCNIPYEMVNPKTIQTKLSSDLFKRQTKWKGQTNEHKRDAAMLVVPFTKRNLEFYLKRREIK